MEAQSSKVSLSASAQEFIPKGHRPKASDECKRMETIKEEKKSYVNHSQNKRDIQHFIPNKLAGCVSVSRQFTQKTIPKQIHGASTLPDIYNYMNTSMAFKNNKIAVCDGSVVIINFDFQDEKTQEQLYCILERQDPKKRNPWRMLESLFTAKDIEDKFDISGDELPAAGIANRRVRIKKSDQLNNDINDRVSDVIFQAVSNVLPEQKWEKIQIYDKENKKRQRILKITKREFVNELREALESPENIRVIKVFNPKEENSLNCVEDMMIIQLTPEISIGISYHYESLAKKVEITGIHLDRDQIVTNHQIASGKHDCHCLDHFKSSIDNLIIGHIYKERNQIRSLREENKKLKKENKNPIIRYIKEVLDGASDLISNDIKTALLCIKEIFNLDAIKEAIQKCLKLHQNTKKPPPIPPPSPIQTSNDITPIENLTNAPMSQLSADYGTRNDTPPPPPQPTTTT